MATQSKTVNYMRISWFSLLDPSLALWTTHPSMTTMISCVIEDFNLKFIYIELISMFSCYHNAF